MTMKHKKKLLVAGAAAAMLATAGWVLAEDAAAPAADAPVADEAAAAPADDAAAPAEETAAAEAEAPVVAAKPRPSEIMPLASRSPMLGLVNTGKHLVAVGDRGQILVSNNGRNWAQVPTPVRSPLTAVTFVDDKNGWAVGHDATILHTADGGKSWELQNFNAELEKPYLSVRFLDANTGFAIGAYGMASKTSDGGKTWTDLDAPAIRADELHLNDIIKLGNGNLLVAGEQGTIGVSADNGNTWEKVNSPYEASLFGALPVGEKGALVYGLRGNVFINNDVRSGSWTKIDTKTVDTFFGGTTTADGKLILVGLSGTILVVDAATKDARSVKIRKDEVTASGRRITDVVTSTLSGVIPFKEGVLVAGDEGIQTLASLQAQ
ncbi:hypothetical protein CJD38_00910 [Stenotrophobium rhamnosiphilum]|uniref:Photosynthesis system II assembly factor Ycf48/Hcf136-like domain-containing protein n=2 Tax=Stenotrophobium rhamnosiphilum TaxID=2029166 RepID=A0A2T5MJG0_9GAMM|nr:hypothetical protein CJD38_00910 [Stenotrophobium rhamnosiphilum]